MQKISGRHLITFTRKKSNSLATALFSWPAFRLHQSSSGESVLLPGSNTSTLTALDRFKLHERGSIGRRKFRRQQGSTCRRQAGRIACFACHAPQKGRDYVSNSLHD